MIQYFNPSPVLVSYLKSHGSTFAAFAAFRVGTMKRIDRVWVQGAESVLGLENCLAQVLGDYHPQQKLGKEWSSVGFPFGYTRSL